MAVKKKGTLPPPIYRTGGKAEHYAIEVLAAERELILERIKSARAEKSFTLAQRRLKIEQWKTLAFKLQEVVDFLKAGRANQRRGVPFLQTTMDSIKKVTDFHKASMDPPPAPQAPPLAGPPQKPAPPAELPADVKAALGLHARAGADAGRKLRANCKHFAKCGKLSYLYCFSKCEKRKKKTCDLIKHYRKRTAAA